MGGIDATGAYVHVAQAQHDPQAMLRLCVSRFLAGGYSLTGQGHGWVSAMKPAAGYMFATSAFQQGHSITVRCDGWTVQFEIRGQLSFGPLVIPEMDAAVYATLEAYNSWMVQHAVMGPPPSQHGGYPPPPASTTHVVEKQVVVVRCKFCQAHTPIDRGTCQSCGAAKFS